MLDHWDRPVGTAPKPVKSKICSAEVKRPAICLVGYWLPPLALPPTHPAAAWLLVRIPLPGLQKHKQYRLEIVFNRPVIHKAGVSSF